MLDISYIGSYSYTSEFLLEFKFPYLNRSFPSGEGNLSRLRPLSPPQFVLVINDLDDNETNSSNNAGSDKNKDLEERGR